MKIVLQVALAIVIAYLAIDYLEYASAERRRQQIIACMEKVNTPELHQCIQDIQK